MVSDKAVRGMKARVQNGRNHECQYWSLQVTTVRDKSVRRVKARRKNCHHDYSHHCFIISGYFRSLPPVIKQRGNWKPGVNMAVILEEHQEEKVKKKSTFWVIWPYAMPYTEYINLVTQSWLSLSHRSLRSMFRKIVGFIVECLD